MEAVRFPKPCYKFAILLSNKAEDLNLGNTREIWSLSWSITEMKLDSNLGMSSLWVVGSLLLLSILMWIARKENFSKYSRDACVCYILHNWITLLGIILILSQLIRFISRITDQGTPSFTLGNSRWDRFFSKCFRFFMSDAMSPMFPSCAINTVKPRY
jgi:hypothetical protein